MESAEMRARIGFLGFTLDSFARTTKRDLRDLKRMQSGRLPVSGPVMQTITDLEIAADEELDRWDEKTKRGEAIYIPRLNAPQPEGALPAHWWLALAGRHLNEWGGQAQIEWAE